MRKVYFEGISWVREDDYAALLAENERLRRLAGRRADFSEAEYEKAWNTFLAMRKRLRRMEHGPEKDIFLRECMQFARKYDFDIDNEKANRLKSERDAALALLREIRNAVSSEVLASLDSDDFHTNGPSVEIKDVPSCPVCKGLLWRTTFNEHVEQLKTAGIAALEETVGQEND